VAGKGREIEKGKKVEEKSPIAISHHLLKFYAYIP